MPLLGAMVPCRIAMGENMTVSTTHEMKCPTAEMMLFFFLLLVLVLGLLVGKVFSSFEGLTLRFGYAESLELVAWQPKLYKRTGLC